MELYLSEQEYVLLKCVTIIWSSYYIVSCCISALKLYKKLKEQNPARIDLILLLQLLASDSNG